MYPELFSIGPITIYTYGVLLAVSYLLGLWLAMRRARKWGLDANRILDLGIYIIIAALVGAKLLLLVVDFDQFSRSPAELLTLARSTAVGIFIVLGIFFLPIFVSESHPKKTKNGVASTSAIAMISLASTKFTLRTV